MTVMLCCFVIVKLTQLMWLLACLVWPVVSSTCHMSPVYVNLRRTRIEDGANICTLSVLCILSETSTRRHSLFPSIHIYLSFNKYLHAHSHIHPLFPSVQALKRVSMWEESDLKFRLCLSLIYEKGQPQEETVFYMWGVPIMLRDTTCSRNFPLQTLLSLERQWRA